MFADLMDKEIQPKSIDVRYLPEIEISDGLKNEIQEILEKEESNYAHVFGRTAVVQTDKNYVFFSNQWLYLAVLIAAVVSGDIGISYCQEVSTVESKHRHSVSVNTGWGLKQAKEHIRKKGETYAKTKIYSRQF